MQSLRTGIIPSYRHLAPYPKDNLYRRLRMTLHLTQRRAATVFGISLGQWCYRERSKRLYSLQEIVTLQEVSGISLTDFMKIVKECA